MTCFRGGKWGRAGDFSLFLFKTEKPCLHLARRAFPPPPPEKVFFVFTLFFSNGSYTLRCQDNSNDFKVPYREALVRTIRGEIDAFENTCNPAKQREGS